MENIPYKKEAIKREPKYGGVVNGVICDKIYSVGNSRIGYSRVGIKGPCLTPEENAMALENYSLIYNELIYKMLKEEY